MRPRRELLLLAVLVCLVRCGEPRKLANEASVLEAAGEAGPALAAAAAAMVAALNECDRTTPPFGVGLTLPATPAPHVRRPLRARRLHTLHTTLPVHLLLAGRGAHLGAGAGLAGG